MKKTLLSLALLSSLTVSGIASAAFDTVVGTANPTETLSLEVGGTITNTNPSFLWDIPDDLATKLANGALDSQRNNGSIDGEYTSFNFSSLENITVLRGVHSAPSAKGGAGLLPQISYGDDTPVSVVGGEIRDLVIPVKALREGVPLEDGILEVKAHGHSGVAFATRQSIEDSQFGILTTAGNEFVANELTALISEKQDPLLSVSTVRHNVSYNEIQLTSQSTTVVKTLTATFHQLSDIKLKFKSISVPTEWSATLPVNITFL